MHISERIQTLATFVRNSSRVADIGTDHGLLPIYLIENNISPFCIASDIGKGPAAAARKNVTARGLSDRIIVRVGDGLSTVSPDEVDDIVIAGMGGETITAILQAAPWAQQEQYRLVLQPMSHAEILREWLYTHGFSPVCERLLTDGGREYIVLVVAFTNAPPVNDTFRFWRGDFSKDEGKNYWRKTAKYLDQRALGCDKQTAEQWQTYAKKLREL